MGSISRFACAEWKVPASEAWERLELDGFVQLELKGVRCDLGLDGLTILTFYMHKILSWEMVVIVYW